MGPLNEAGETRLDYRRLSQKLEEVRARYEAKGLRVHIVGFAKVMGDLIGGVYAVLFFAAAVAVTAAILFWFTRCWRSTLLVPASSLVAIVWLIGLLVPMGLELNPYSILVPFLVFAIGVSHVRRR